ncbi:putative First C2 domain of RPGR-interacting protein 1 [Monocercomonoides exilis]|uniref:putative First C2 domain of RPGR-interacting protein 1 n=1 Tax=Monocercomonoides exilis TaxID=2049356 RepID=UPI003559F5A2|nr:putative First C2 domain of RPGR-interacting protein 1 [Monocercomonoides exilis]|eukprot:MONOS_1179.1-p1 / transcript=MONOS_1179.1 / gene=MONOS_1179 / organism=Monocercomonoides_exilis_PA203 / gene_product=unspecified product / transcript_product=unspecified product / location=Mono_scaffold00020:53460-56484(-) / protein_length=634 / sequence_SO=supercontig / SO=protein_coding / is_pseudo=false
MQLGLQSSKKQSSEKKKKSDNPVPSMDEIDDLRQEIDELRQQQQISFNSRSLYSSGITPTLIPIANPTIGRIGPGPQNEIEQLKSIVSQKTEEIKRIDRKLSEQKREIKMQLQETNRVVSENEQLKRTIGELRLTISQLQGQLAEAQKEKEEAKDEILRLHSTSGEGRAVVEQFVAGYKAKLEKEVRMLKTEIKRLNEINATQKNDLSQLKGWVKTLQDEAEAVTEENTAQKKECHDLKNQLKKADKKIQLLLKANEALQMRCSAAQEGSTSIPPLLLAYKDQILALPQKSGQQMLEHALLIVKKWMCTAGEEMDEMTADEHKARLDKLMKLIEGKGTPGAAAIAKLKKEIQALREENEQLKRNIERLKREHSGTSSDKEALIAQVEQANEEIRKLNCEADFLTQRIESHQLYQIHPSLDDHTLQHGENVIAVHIKSAKLNPSFFAQFFASTSSPFSSSSSASSSSSIIPTTFLLADFFLFDSQQTPVADGFDPHYDFIARYCTENSLFFEHFLMKHQVQFELYSVKVVASCVAKGSLSFAGLLDDCNEQQLTLSLFSETQPKQIVGTVDVSIQALLPFHRSTSYPQSASSDDEASSSSPPKSPFHSIENIFCPLCPQEECSTSNEESEAEGID